jgi:FdhE protein
MTSYLALTPEQVKKEVDSVKKSRPAYVEILEFYGKVFDAQEQCKGRLQLEPPELSEELQTVKAREQLPLIGVDEFNYDNKESADLFLALSHLALEANPGLSKTAKVIVAATGEAIKPEALFDGLLKGNEALFENLAEELKIDKTVLGFLTYNSIKPSLCACADQLAVYLDHTDPWQQGYCPVCGSAPVLSLLEDEGRRKLVCSFCWHLWPAKRVQCPCCEGSGSEDLHYFYSEAEKDTRVDLCDKCQKYIKSIDTRKTARLIYPPLEHISTMHLDIKAQEMGFEPGIRLFMQA